MAPTPASGRHPTTAEVALVALSGPDEGVVIALLPGDLTIGRSAPCEVIIDSRLVSKYHARVRRAGTEIIIDDLKSPNGTFVNGKRVHISQTLLDGDLVSIAGVRSYAVRITAPPPEPAPAEPAPAAAPPPHADPEVTLVRPRRTPSVRLEGPGGPFVLKAGSHIVGRGESAAVALEDRGVSRKHAIIAVSASAVTIEDQGSANGTLVNDEPTVGARELRTGDRVLFGDLEFVVQVDGV